MVPPDVPSNDANTSGVSPTIDIDPATLSPRDAYRLLIGGILPRPIAWVSTIAPDGTCNLAPFSFFTVVCEAPPTICFAPARKPDGGKKDSLANVEATGEFVVNVVGEAQVSAMSHTSASVGPEVDEFALAGLVAVPSTVVRPPRVAGVPVAYECRLVQVVHVGGDAAGAGSLVIGSVVRVHVAAEAWRDGRIDIDVARQVGRAAGDDYVRTRDRFALRRPVVDADGTVRMPDDHPRG